MKKALSTKIMMLIVLLLISSLSIVSCTTSENGTDAESLSVSGMVDPFDCLTLQHNLGRDDLTFTAQFVKDGHTYDYGEYEILFGYEVGQLTLPTVFASTIIWRFSATTLNNGNFVITYSDNGNFGNGTLVIYDPSGNEIVAPKVFASTIST